ncbi:MAG: CvpA family protein [Chloroflexota bacterium]|nr:CvpA family protein [Anaerolineales bacterium]MCB8967938.1 CvpA family protein [Ardenticatenaceae bacterium]
MIELDTLFWVLVSFFALIGMMRGWTKEVIATSSLILSLFALTQIVKFPFVASFLSTSVDPSVLDFAIRRKQFYVLSIIHIAIAFFGYQGPAFAGSRINEKLRIRDSFQDKVLGLVIGAINGYLIVGALWAFLEYPAGPSGFAQLLAGVPYPFDSFSFIRPGIAPAPISTMIDNLPLPFLAPYLPILVVLVFLFVIVVMI